MPHTVPVLAASLEERGAREADVLKIDDVQRTFKDGRKRLTAVYHVSLALQKGETFGLVGESGSGKTTLAKCVTGLLAPDSGTIEFEGGVLKATAGKRSQDALRAIQMVFQNPDSTLNPAWTTRSILTRAVRKLGGARGGSVRAKVDTLSAGVRVEPRFLFQKPMELSGGQKQRIAIARAFAGDPTLVVCDEPASALDVSVQASILNLLVELQTQGEGLLRVHQPRPRRGALHQRPHRGDVPGRAHRGRLIERCVQPAAPPLHRGPAQLDPQARLRQPQPAHPAAGHDAEPLGPAPGCRFHTRCHRFLGDICENQVPPEQEAGDGHIYACHIPPEELLRLQSEGQMSGEGAKRVADMQARAAEAMAAGEQALAAEGPAAG